MATSNSKIPDIPPLPPSPTKLQLSIHIRRLRHVNSVLRTRSTISSTDMNLAQEWINIASRKATAQTKAEMHVRSAALLLKALCVSLLQDEEMAEPDEQVDGVPAVKQKMDEVGSRGDPAPGDWAEISAQIELVDSALDILLAELKLRNLEEREPTKKNNNNHK